MLFFTQFSIGPTRDTKKPLPQCATGVFQSHGQVFACPGGRSGFPGNLDFQLGLGAAVLFLLFHAVFEFHILGHDHRDGTVLGLEFELAAGETFR